MRKKLGIIFLFAAVLAVILCLSASAETISGKCGTNVNWSLDYWTGVLEISGTGKMADYSAQNQAPWYSYRSWIETIVISSGVTSIGASAFEWCQSLTNVMIPNSVTTIGWGAFTACKSLTNVTIPDGVTTIWVDAFLSCWNLRSVTIPDSVKTIGAGAFDGCNALTYVYYTGSSTQLQKISIGSDNTPLFNAIFYVNCSSPVYSGSCGTGVNWSFDLTTGLLVISGNGKMADYEPGQAPWYYYFSGEIISVYICTGVTRIGDFAFQWCESLENVTIPNSVTSIGHYAFAECISLESVTIPDGVTSIGFNPFLGCSFLNTIKVEVGNPVYQSKKNCLIATASKTLIAGCQSSVIPADGNVTSIGDYAFFGQTGLTSVTIPDSVTSIGYCAFYNCYNLTDVYYSGTESQWNKIDIDNEDDGNEHLAGANIHFSPSPEPEVLRGDFDGNGSLTSADAVYLLRHVMLGDSYAITQSGDVDGSGTLTSADAVYLLRAIMLGEASYPLAN